MIGLTKEKSALIGIAVVMVVVLPVLNMLSPDSILYLPDFYLNLFGKYLSLAILALGLNLLWGYTGILSLCQAVFFGLGGYCIGMYMMLQIGAKQSKYGEALPDFMVWNQIKELPLFWKPFSSFWFTVLAVLLVPTLFAIAFGYLTFRSRIRGVYVAILTQALAFAAWLLFNRNEMKLGGTNGLTDFKTLAGFSLLNSATQRGLYIITALSLVASYAVCHWIVTSKMGKVLLAVRDNENRLLFSGFSTTGFKIFAFSVSALLGGLAGALYVPQVGIITPSQIGVLPSLEVVVWVALGGRGSLIGGPLGAIVVNGLRTILTTKYPQLWPFILGGLFVCVVLLFPNGLVGLPDQFKRFLQLTRLRWIETKPFVATGYGMETLLNSDQGESGGIQIAAESINSEGASRNGKIPRTAEETILYLEGVTVSFEGFLALRNLNFYMKKGELRFMIGPNGAGKTTLLDVVCGKVKPIQGRVFFEETDLLSLREFEIVRSGIGRKFQTPAIFPHHTVFDNLGLSLKTKKQVIPTLFERHVGEDRERIRAILRSIRLIEQESRLAGSLSHGQKQWLEIGMLMAQDPKLLLIDEPVAGMTGKERDDTGRLLETVLGEHSVLVIEHDMEFVRHFGRTVTVMHEGSVLCEGPMDKVQSDPRVIEVYLGREHEAHV
jgi:urea transport system permease protein